MQIFPQSESILLPLAPTIAGAIAEYLRQVTREFYIKVPHNDHNTITQLPIERSIASWRLGLPLRRVPTSQYQYVSAIAYRLAAKLPLTPLQVCQKLQLPQSLPVSTVDCLEIDVCCDDSGYIYFKLTPQAIATWLNHLHNLPRDFRPRLCPETALVAPDARASSIAIYAHARCCSVLTLARNEGLVSLSDTWQITTPDWLSCIPKQHAHDLSHAKNRLRAQPMLIFEQGVEEQLIHALMDVLDGTWSAYADDRLKISQFQRFVLDLARCWLEFHRHCRIFGALQRQNPRLAIARCGLTAICRRYLQILLEDCLGVTAPTEL